MNNNTQRFFAKFLIVLNVVLIITCAILALIIHNRLNSDTIDETIVIKNINKAINNTIVIDVQNNCSYGEALRNKVFAYNILEEDFGLAGAKLIAECSADANGDSSSIPNNTTSITIFSYQDLGFYMDNSPKGIYQNIINRKIRISQGKVRRGLWYFSQAFVIDFIFSNLTNNELDITVNKGQMLEVNGLNVQNLVVNESVYIHLMPKESKEVNISAYCASQHRGSPTGYLATFTPFVLGAECSTFDSQESIWEYIEENYQRLITKKHL